MSALTLASYQKTMGLHLRDPENESAPENLDTRRLGVYKDLVFNNVESQLAASFPVISGILGQDRWVDLVREFLRDYRSQTPYFTQLSGEFVGFLAETSDRSNRPKFLIELAHYERVEIDLFMKDEPYDRSAHDKQLLLERPIGLVDTTELLAYASPVHRIAPEYQPDEAPETPSLLLLFQDDEGEVRFFELQALAYHLVSMIGQNSELSGQELLEVLANNLSVPYTDLFRQQGTALLEQLNQLKVLRFL